MKKIQFAGAILLALGFMVATGAVVNVTSLVAAAMLLFGGAWIQRMTVREFVRRILAGEEPAKYDTIRHRDGAATFRNVA